MHVVLSGEKLPEEALPIIILEGPDRTDSWFLEAIEELRKMEYGGIVISPRTKTRSVSSKCCGKNETAPRINYMVIWIPKETNSPAFISALIALNWTYRGKLIIGIHPKANIPRPHFVEHFAKIQKIPFFYSLKEALSAALWKTL